MSGEAKEKPSVAPGYPAAGALRDIDVTGYEPAAVFHPVEPETEAKTR
jgi:hypothetical protein